MHMVLGVCEIRDAARFCGCCAIARQPVLCRCHGLANVTRVEHHIRPCTKSLLHPKGHEAKPFELRRISIMIPEPYEFKVAGPESLRLKHFSYAEERVLQARPAACGFPGPAAVSLAFVCI